MLTIDLRRKPRIGEQIIQFTLLLCGLLSILITIGIVVVLFFDALAFFRLDEVTLVEFFTGTAWQPQILLFGLFPLFNATMLTSAIGLLVAVPLGLMIAIYLSEYASPRARGILKPVLEILAGIPTVVFGYFALNFMTPILQGVFGKDTVEIFNVASAGIVIGILIIPLISSMSEDALSAVPRALREGAYAPGRHPAGDGGQGGVAGSHLRHRCCHHRRHVARRGRDDGRGHRSRRRPAQLQLLERSAERPELPQPLQGG